MPENPNQPKAFDAVKGGQASAPFSSAILGGIECVRSRLASAVKEQRIAALYEALKYGEEGLDLVIYALKDESEQVEIAAYLLLRERTEPKAKQALRGYNPWQMMKCLGTLKGYSSKLRFIPISPSGQKVFVGSRGEIRVWDWQTGIIQTRSLQGHSDDVNFFAISSFRWAKNYRWQLE